MGKHDDLLKQIDLKLAEAKAKQLDKKLGRTKPKPATRAEINRANGANSPGPRTPEGKARASANSLKHGYFAHIEKLNPYDSASYAQIAHELRDSLSPDGAAEDMLVKEIAMLAARIKRLEATEYALVMGNVEGEPPELKPFNLTYDDADHNPNSADARALAAAHVNNLDSLERLNKIETHLRRAYNRAWDRLERMQRERRKPPSRPRTRRDYDESPKRTHRDLTDEEQTPSGRPDPDSFAHADGTSAQGRTQAQPSPSSVVRGKNRSLAGPGDPAPAGSLRQNAVAASAQSPNPGAQPRPFGPAL